MTNTRGSIFISWSGERSRYVARALKDWLPAVLQAANPWMLDPDFDKGVRFSLALEEALANAKVGILCLTPENISSAWMHYEAGALSKVLGHGQLFTYLVGGLEPQDVPPPLSMIQATRATKEDTRQLLRAINRAIGDPPLPEAVVDKIFDHVWAELGLTLNVMPPPRYAPPPKRSLEDMVAEMLDMMRTFGKGLDALTARVDQFSNMPSRGRGSRYSGALISVPDQDWIKFDPNCPNCGSLQIISDNNPTGRRLCLNCGAMSATDRPTMVG